MGVFPGVPEGEALDLSRSASAHSNDLRLPHQRAARAEHHCKNFQPNVALSGAEPLRLERALGGSVVLVTGGTGFVGSVVVEQVLRLLPTVKRIYLLIRSKRGQSAEERLEWLLHNKALFSSLLVDGKLPASLREKVAAVSGDTTLPGLCLSDADRSTLTEEVNWVIHSAASISFFEHIHTLLSQNYEATRKVAELAQDCRDLQGFVYVSTAYVNSNLPRCSHIEEAIYPLHQKNGSPVQHGETASRLGGLPAASAEREAQALLKECGLPNSYCLTKHMCEDLLADLHSTSFPVCIVRPSIIGALAAAPLPGYFGNAAGLTSATLAFATGMARYTCHNPFSVYDVIPCDVVGHVILGALPALQLEAVRSQPVLVLHACSSTTNPLIFADAMNRVVIPYWQQAPPRHRLSNKPYKLFETKNAWVEYDSFTFKLLTVKANMRMARIELILRLVGKKKFADLINSSWKVWKLYNTPTMDFELFFCCKNVIALAGLFDTAEKAQLKLNMVWSTENDWWSYIYAHQTAIRAKYYSDTVNAAKGFTVNSLPLTEEERLKQVVLQARGPSGRSFLMSSYRQASTVPSTRSPQISDSPPALKTSNPYRLFSAPHLLHARG